MAVKTKGAAASNELAIVYKAVADLEPYANNPRKNDDQVPRMVDLIKKFGFKVPLLVRGNQIVDGHLRIKAATKMGMATVPTIDVGAMPEAEERALRIALNKSVEWAEWDNDLLGTEMKAIMAGGLDLNLTGFDSSEFDKLIKEVAEPKPTAPSVNKTKLADAGTPADPDYVSLSFHMTAANRDTLMAALEKYRTQHELVNQSQALLSMAKAWVGASK